MYVFKTLTKHLPASLILLSAAALAADNKPTVEAFLKAYNERDTAAMLALAHPEILWMGVADDAVYIEASGHAELNTAMTAYFKDFPSSRSEILSLTSNGRFATALEQASWEQDGTARVQCSISVYQLDAGKIMNVWYYPAESCDR